MQICNKSIELANGKVDHWLLVRYDNGMVGLVCFIGTSDSKLTLPGEKPSE